MIQSAIALEMLDGQLKFEMWGGSCRTDEGSEIYDAENKVDSTLSFFFLLILLHTSGSTYLQEKTYLLEI